MAPCWSVRGKRGSRKMRLVSFITYRTANRVCAGGNDAELHGGAPGPRGGRAYLCIRRTRRSACAMHYYGPYASPLGQHP